MSPHASQDPGISTADTGFVPRQWIAHTSRPPESPGVGTMVAVLLCSIYQSLLVAMLLFGDSAGAPEITASAAGSLIVGVGGIAAAVVLAWVPRIPLVVLAIELAMLVAAALVSVHDAVLFPALFAVYGAASRLPPAKLLLAVLLTGAGVTISAVLVGGRAGFFAEYLGLLAAVLAAAAIGIAARSVRGWRRSQLQALQDTQTAELLTRQRNIAEARSRIAARLHDSVGHKLTSIIALSEGLLGAAVDAETEEAILGINTVARESLAETRRAVRALAETAERGEGAHAAPQWTDEAAGARVVDRALGERDPWGLAEELMEQTRALGLDVEFTETGERALDSELAQFCFMLTREALTNAVRYGGVPGRVTVGWDHRSDETRIVVRNSDVHPVRRPLPGGGPGTGLLRMRAEIEERGGTLAFGWDPQSTWTVRAVIPVTVAGVLPAERRLARRWTGDG